MNFDMVLCRPTLAKQTRIHTCNCVPSQTLYNKNIFTQVSVMPTSKKDKLFTAIIENNVAAAEKLLKGGFLNNMSPNYKQQVTPWIQSGQLKVGDRQKIWEISNISPLHLAVVLNQPEMVNKLVQHQADVNKRIFYVQMTGPEYAISELLTPLFFSVYEIAHAADQHEEKKALEIYCVLRAANARLVGFDDPTCIYFGTNIAQEHIDRHMAVPELKQAYERAEEHFHVASQKSVFVAKLSQNPERMEEQNSVNVQRIKL